MAKMTMKDGTVLEAATRPEMEAKVVQWIKAKEAEIGYDRSFKMRSDEEVSTEAGKQYIKDNPFKGRMAAMGAGTADLGRNLAQMALPERGERLLGLTDEAIRSKRAEAQPLKDAHGGYHLAGQVLPAIAAAPLLSAGGAAVTAGSGVARAAAAHPLAASMASMGAEGALFGAATEDPGSRLEGAAGGAAAGMLGAGVLGAGRRVAKGLVPVRDEVTAAINANKFGMRNAEDIFVPTNLAGPTVGKGATMTSLIRGLGNVSDAGRANLNAQAEQAGKSSIANLIRKGFGSEGGDVARDALGVGSDFRTAIKTGLATLPSKGSGIAAGKPFREILDASAEASKTNIPSMDAISRSAVRKGAQKFQEISLKKPGLRTGKEDLAIMLERGVDEDSVRIAMQKMSEVLGARNLPQTMGNRAILYNFLNMWPVKIATDRAAKLGTSKGFQKWVMGQATHQKVLSAMIDKGGRSGAKSQIKQSIAAYMGVNEEDVNKELIDRFYEKVEEYTGE